MATNFIGNAVEASFSLNDLLADFDKNTSFYTRMPKSHPYSHFFYALNIVATAEDVIKELKRYLAELERGECSEVLCIEKKMMQKEYWEKDGLLQNLEALRSRYVQDKKINIILKALNIATCDDFIRHLEDSYAEVARLLSEIHEKILDR